MEHEIDAPYDAYIGWFLFGDAWQNLLSIESSTRPTTATIRIYSFANKWNRAH